MAEKDLGKTSFGMQANLAALLCYLPMFGLIIGIIFYIIEKQNKFVRFHAMQTILLAVALTIAGIIFSIIPVLGWIAAVLLWPASLIILIVMMVKSYQGELFKLPYIGDIAEKNS